MADALSEALDAFYEMQNGVAPTPAPTALVTFKPMKSNGLKVHPSQVREAREFAAKSGVPTDYTPDGHPVITSSRQFRRLAKVQGFVHHGYVWAVLAVLVGSAARGEHARPPVPHTPEPPAAMPLGDPGPDPLAAKIARFGQWADVAFEYRELAQNYGRWSESRRWMEQDRAWWPAHCALALNSHSAWWSLTIVLNPNSSEGWRLNELDCLRRAIGEEAFDKGWMPVPRPCDRWEADP